jgi:hypothetical protein
MALHVPNLSVTNWHQHSPHVHVQLILHVAINNIMMKGCRTRSINRSCTQQQRYTVHAA